MVNVTDIHSLTEFQRHARAMIGKVKETGNPLVLTVNGRPATTSAGSLIA